ncbi:MAG: ATP-binding protein [Candidatus Binatia bacterium]
MHGIGEGAIRARQGTVDLDHGYPAQIAHIVTARLPFAIVGFLLSFAFAWIVEDHAHPGRSTVYAIIYGLEAFLCGLGLVFARRAQARPRRCVNMTVLTVIGLVVLVTSYHIVVSGELEILGLALSYLIVGTMVLFPWGGQRQLVVVGASLAMYCGAIGLGVGAITPIGLNVIGLAFIGSVTVAGALSDERFRRNLFRQEAELARASAELRREISERRRVDENLRVRTSQQAVVAELGQYALANSDLSVLMEHAVRVVATTLGVEYAKVLELLPGGSELRLRAGVGWNEGLVGHATVSAETDSQAGYTIRSNGPVIVTDFRSESRFSGPPLLCDHGVVAGMSVIIQGQEQPFGVLGAHTRHRRTFTVDDVHFLQGVANVLAEAVARLRAEQSVREQVKIYGALARVGQALISALDQPALLDRLCEVSAQVLDCDTSHTLLWQQEGDVFIPVAGYGATPEEQEVARAVRVPRALMGVLFSRLEHDDVAEVHTTPSDVLSTPQQRQSWQLCMALRRGDAIIGLQVANVRTSPEPFTPTQRRIAGGVAQLASLALENARLVEELARASRLKSEFVSTMSHELRTPLNVIIGYNDLLREGAFGALAPEQMEPVQRVERSARELLDLINATLNLSRLETGHVEVDVQEVQISHLIDAVKAETEEIREKPEVRFEWHVAPDLPPLRTDVLKLKVVLKNLVTNAAKFTDHGCVIVRAAACERGVEFCVEDTGVGISPEALPIIFDPFRQVDGSTTRRHGGVGLGLYIVRRLLMFLGGTITVDSTVGTGSRFRVWLPPVHGSVARRVAA